LFVKVEGDPGKGLPAEAAGQVPLRGPGIFAEVVAAQRCPVEEKLTGQALAWTETNLLDRVFGYASGHLYLQVLARPVQKPEDGDVGIEHLDCPVQDQTEQIVQSQAGNQGTADFTK
jgi:hypothetical protein